MTTGILNYRATACNATHGIIRRPLCPLSVRLQCVRLSDKRLHYDKTKELCAHILYHMKGRLP